jgi:hypothetical protein
MSIDKILGSISLFKHHYFNAKTNNKELLPSKKKNFYRRFKKNIVKDYYIDNYQFIRLVSSIHQQAYSVIYV